MYDVPKRKRGKNLTNEEKERLQKQKIAHGTPTLFREEYCKHIVDLAEKEILVDYMNQCCASLKISYDTFTRWSMNYPCFYEAFKQGKIIWKANLDKALVDGTILYTTYKTAYYQGLRMSCEPVPSIQKTITIASPDKILKLLEEDDQSDQNKILELEKND